MIRAMEKLREYLNGLDSDKQERFASRCDTTVGYLRKAISTKQLLGPNLVIAIERETAGAVNCEDLRPDVDWQFLRNTA